MKKIYSIILIFIFAFTLTFAPRVSGAVEDISISAQSAVLMETGTTKVLHYKAAHEELAMASTTKIMTAILGIERGGNLDALVAVSPEAYGVEGSSIYLKMDEKISLRDLLYGLMLSSGNDAAVAIACYIGGSVEGFAQMMNEKAESIGAMDTHFVTPNGLHDDMHYTTAYNLALIASYAMRNEVFREIVGTEYYKTTTGDVQRTFKNKNKLLWEYEGGNGVKTGYTMKAGKCLVFSAERDGFEILGVVLNAPDMFLDAKQLLDYGFENFSLARAIAAGEILAQVPVRGGRKNMLALTVKEDIMIPVGNEETLNVRTRIVTKDDIEAPVEAGMELGTLELWDVSRLLASCPLIAAENIDAVSFSFFFERLIRSFIA